MTDNELIDLQLKEILKLKDKNTVLHEAAVRALHKATGKCWKECDAMLDMEMECA